MSHFSSRSGAQKELDGLLAEESPAQFERQAEQIAALHAKLDRKIKKPTAEREREAESRNSAAAAEIADFKREIDDVERATRDVQENIEKSWERYQQVMKSLQASLEQKGITTPQSTLKG
jgi:molecular chaperone GrpE (heat shock protein)